MLHVEDTKVKNIKPFIEASVGENVERVMTDQFLIYPFALKPLNLTDRHEVVNHIIGEYVRGDAYTNSTRTCSRFLSAES